LSLASTGERLAVVSRRAGGVKYANAILVSSGFAAYAHARAVLRGAAVKRRLSSFNAVRSSILSPTACTLSFNVNAVALSWDDQNNRTLLDMHELPESIKPTSKYTAI